MPICCSAFRLPPAPCWRWAVAPLQYVLRASRCPRPSLHLDCLSLRPQAGMVDVRILQPLRSLTSQPSITARVTAGSIELLTADSTLPRLLIWQRPLLILLESLAQLRVLLRNGYVIVSEYDDYPGPLACDRGLSAPGVQGGPRRAGFHRAAGGGDPAP